MFTKRMILVFFSVFVILSMTAAQCGAPTTVMEKIVKETVVVEKVVTKEVVVTATPEAMLFSAAPPAPDLKNPDTYVVAVFDEVESFEPAWSYDIAGMAVLMNIYEGMIFFEREKVDEFAPQLATDWKVSDDGLTYTFNIRQGVKFHEGGALEPHDIAYSLQRAMLQDRLDGPMWLFLEPIFGVSTIADLAIKNYAEAAGIAEDSDAYEELSLEEVDDVALKKTCEMVQEAVQADDDARTVTLKLGKITPWFLQILAQPWGAALDMEWMVEQGDWDGKCDNWIEWHDPALEQTILFEKTNGTGPYKLDRWTHGEEILLVANDDYWRTEPIWENGPSGPPKIEQVNFKLVRDWDTRLAMLHAGDADYAAVPEAFYSQVEPMVKTIYLEGDEQGKSDPGPGNTLKEFRNLAEAYMTPALFNFNVNTEGCNPYVGSGKLDGSGIPADFFSDIHVRKAFNYCFDWDAFLQDGLGGNAIQPRGPIIKGVLGYDENSPVYSYDLAKCEEEFKASGWKAEDGTSLWDTGFYFQLVYNTGNEPRRIAAEIIKKNVEAINPKFTLTIINLPWTPFMEGQSQGVFPIFLSGWGEDYHDPSNWVYGFMSSSSGSYARTQNFPEDLQREIDDLIAQGLATTDVAKREPIYKKLQQIAYEQAIDIFLYQSVLRGYFQRWIHGFYFNPIYPKYGYSYIYALSKSE